MFKPYRWSEVSKGEVMVLRSHRALKGVLRTLACMMATWEPVGEFDQGETDLPYILKGPVTAMLRVDRQYAVAAATVVIAYLSTRHGRVQCLRQLYLHLP